MRAVLGGLYGRAEFRGPVDTYQPWFFPVTLALFLATLIKLLIQAIQRRKFVNLFLALGAGRSFMSQTGRNDRFYRGYSHCNDDNGCNEWMTF